MTIVGLNYHHGDASAVLMVEETGKRVASNGHMLLKREFTWDKVVRTIERTYDEVMGEGNHAS